MDWVPCLIPATTTSICAAFLWWKLSLSFYFCFCWRPSILLLPSIWKQKELFINIFHYYFKNWSLSEIDELLTSDSWKDVNQNSGSTGNTEQSLHVYQKMNSMVTETSQANVASADLMLIHVDLLAVRALKSWNDAYLQCLNVA